MCDVSYRAASLPLGDIYVVELDNVDDSSNWIEVEIWVGLDGSDSAMVYHFDDRSYSVDFTNY